MTLYQESKNETVIFVDLDGVLADFWTAAAKAHGIDPDTVPEENKTVWDMSTWLCEGSHDKFWETINSKGSGFWSDIEPYPWAIDLWEAVKQEGRAVILTSPSRSHWAAAGKMLWLQKHLGDVDFLIGRAKWSAAGMDKILIDDLEKNIDSFVANGGDGILFKRPWAPHGVGPEVDEIIKHVRELKEDVLFHVVGGGTAVKNV